MVIKHQQYSGRHQNEECAQRQGAQVPGGAEGQGARTDLDREQMQEHILLNGLRAVQVAGAAAAAEDRLPDFRVAQPVKFFPERDCHYTLTNSCSLRVSERSTIRYPSSLNQTFSHGSGCGAGPAILMPSRLKRLPWHGHAIMSSSGFHAVRQPRCVQMAPSA